MSRPRGVLRALFFAVEEPFHGSELLVLGCEGGPPYCGMAIGQRLSEDAPDMGDYECVALPSWPEKGGLWLWEWAWREVQHPDDPSDTTVPR